MNVLMWILAVIGGIIAVMLFVGGVIFWRGWFYAVRHRDEMVAHRLELDKMLNDNRRLLEDVERLERAMDYKNKQHGNGE